MSVYSLIREFNKDSSFFKEMETRLRANPCQHCAAVVREKFNALPPEQQKGLTVDYLTAREVN